MLFHHTQPLMNRRTHSHRLNVNATAILTQTNLRMVLQVLRRIPCSSGGPTRLSHATSTYAPNGNSIPSLHEPFYLHATYMQIQPRPPRIKEDYYQLSICLSVTWCLMCAPYLLVCTLPALLLSRRVSPLS